MQSLIFAHTKVQSTFDHSRTLVRQIDTVENSTQPSYYFGKMRKGTETTKSLTNLSKTNNTTTNTSQKLKVPTLKLNFLNDIENSSVPDPKMSVVTIGELYDSSNKNSARLSEPPLITLQNSLTARRRYGSENGFLESYLKEKQNESTTKSRQTVVHLSRIKTFKTPENKSKSKLLGYLKYLDRQSLPNEKTKFQEKLMKKASPDNSMLQDDDYGFESLIKLPPLPVVKRQTQFRNLARIQTQSSKGFSPTIPSQDQFSRKESSLAENSTILQRQKSIIKRQDSIFKGLKRQDSVFKDFSLKGLKHSDPVHIQKDKMNLFDYHSGLAIMKPFKGTREFFQKLSNNLHELYQMMENDKKVYNILDELSNGDKKVLEFVHAKFHKIADYDPDKLMRRFVNIEVVQPQPGGNQPPQFIRKGDKLAKPLGITIEPATITQLIYFNERLQDFNLAKKKVILNNLTDTLINGEEKLLKFRRKRMQLNTKTKALKIYTDSEKIKTDRATIDPFQFYEFDPLTAIDIYATNHGELKFIDQGIIQKAKQINETFDTWIHFVEENDV